jgi:hypothetical protein
MPAFRTRKLRTAVLAVVSTGVIAGSSVVAAQIADAQAAAPPRPPCPAIEPLVPGENNYIVGNPDNIQVIGGVASWDEIWNVGGAPGSPGLRLSQQTSGLCRYNYEIWGNSSLGSAFFKSSEFFRTVRPWG